MKTVIQVDIYCLKCKTGVMKAVSSLTGVDKVEVNEEKNTVTVVGDVDPVAVTKKLRKSRRTARILSAGPEKEEPKKEEKKEAATPFPSCCQKCETIFVSYDGQSCAIL